jgi:hypothetical protein
MTSWPWMKGVGVALADPAPPLNEHDERPSAKALIDENRGVIEQVKKELQGDSLYDAAKHDELWILRFLLSHKQNTKHAVKAAKTTLAFRKEHRLDDKDIRAHPVGKNCPNEIVRQHQAYCQDGAIQFLVPDPRRGVIGFLHYAGIDQHAMVKNLDKSIWLPALGYVSEFSFQWVDYVTRTTGRLTKSVRLVDCRGFSMSQISYECLKRDGDAMSVMEDCYPQMLQGIFLCNPPAWIHVPWKVCRSILPKRLIEKIDFIRPDKNEKERTRLFKHIALQHLPIRFGGQFAGFGSQNDSSYAGGEAEADAADLDALKKKADEDGNESDNYEEIYDDIPVS